MARAWLRATFKQKNTISMIHLYTFVHKHALRCSFLMVFLNSTSLSQKMKTVEEKSGVVKQTCDFQNFKPTDRSKNQEEGAPNCRPTFHANNFSRIIASWFCLIASCLCKITTGFCLFATWFCLSTVWFCLFAVWLYSALSSCNPDSARIQTCFLLLGFAHSGGLYFTPEEARNPTQKKD